MKTRIKKCLICFKNTSCGAKTCEHCGFKFKTSRGSHGWHDKLRGLVSRLSRFRV